MTDSFFFFSLFFSERIFFLARSRITVSQGGGEGGRVGRKKGRKKNLGRTQINHSGARKLNPPRANGERDANPKRGFAVCVQNLFDYTASERFRRYLGLCSHTEAHVWQNYMASWSRRQPPRPVAVVRECSCRRSVAGHAIRGFKKQT